MQSRKIKAIINIIAFCYSYKMLFAFYLIWPMNQRRWPEKESQNKWKLLNQLFLDLITLQQFQQLMGTCTAHSAKSMKKKQSDCPKIQQQSQSIVRDQKEIHCLKLIYEDLVQRCPENAINQKTFQLFFHMNHVIGGALFRIFSNNNASKQITEQMFIESVLKFSKSNIQQKIKLLFSLYNQNQNKGICFNQFLAMLLNFPEEQIKEILSKDQFLDYLTTQQISYYLLASKNTQKQQLNKQYKSTLSLFPHVPLRKKSTNFDSDIYGLNSMFKLNMQGKQSLASNNQSTKSKPKKSQPNSERSAIIQKLKKNIDKSTLTTQIFRKYSEFIFQKYNLNKKTNQISFEIFSSLLKQHPRLYQQFFQGFHQHLWVHTDGNPLYKKKAPRIQGYCIQICKNQEKKVFIITLRNSLLTFQNQQMIKPLSIRNLQGLLVYQIQGPQGFGFGIKDKSKLYSEHKYYFQSKELQREWLKQLNQFQEQHVFQKYRLLQKIGKGNFSIVYKCENIQSGEKRAIKIIDKSNITQQQIASVRCQSQILAICSMPHVLRAFQRFQTNTHIYLVTELIQGGTLHQYVKNSKQKHLSETQAKKIMQHLLIAVKNMHGIGIIHRDLKLQNILINFENGECVPKIIDFGLAIFNINLKNIDDNSKYVGTPNYIPPQVFYHSQFNETVDVFSLGVIMHFLLTGYLPFHATSINTIRQLTTQCFINFETKRWVNISQNAKNLLSSMICEKNYRISASQALEHQWFKQSSHDNPEY